VKKTSVYLTEREIARLARLADVEDVSQAEIIRRAISSYAPHGPRHFRMAGGGSGPGGSIADLPDEELLEGFGE
jgi:hypothetical protein